MGHKLSQQSIEKIKKSLTGKKRPQSVREKISKSLIGHKRALQKQVICIETKMMFDSAAEASRYINRKECAVSRAARERKTAGGFH